MKGIVFDLKRGSVKDGPGLRTSVFLKGCPLRCVWCHNPESQACAPEPMDGTTCGREMSVEEVMREVLADKPFYAAVGGMTLTGGEPLLQDEFAAALCRAAKDEGVPVAVDTCGAVPWTSFEKVLPWTDLFLYDLKCADPIRHRELTGQDNARILGNLSRLSAAGATVELRCPLVPGLTDSEADLAFIAATAEREASVTQVTLLGYHPIGLSKYAKLGRVAPFGRKEFASAAERRRWLNAVASGTKRKVVLA